MYTMRGNTVYLSHLGHHLEHLPAGVADHPPLAVDLLPVLDQDVAQQVAVRGGVSVSLVEDEPGQPPPVFQQPFH